MRVSEEGLALIQRFEGFSATTYRDAAGLPTIGYGHLIRIGEKFPEPLTQEAATQLLRRDVRAAETAVHGLIRVQLAQAQFDALVSFTFNLGSGTLERSTLRRVLNREEYTDVPAQLLRYVWAGGRKLRGLMLRRAAEAALFSRKTGA